MTLWQLLLCAAASRTSFASSGRTRTPRDAWRLGEKEAGGADGGGSSCPRTYS